MITVSLGLILVQEILAPPPPPPSAPPLPFIVVLLVRRQIERSLRGPGPEHERSGTDARAAVVVDIDESPEE